MAGAQGLSPGQGQALGRGQRPGQGQGQGQGQGRGLDQGLKPHDHRPRPPAPPAARPCRGCHRRAGDHGKTRAGCKPAWGSPGGVAGGAGRRKPLALARWVTCSCPHAPSHTRRSELSTETIHSACGAAHWRAARQLAGRAASMVGRPTRRSVSTSSSRALTRARRSPDTQERPARPHGPGKRQVGGGVGCACCGTGAHA